MTFASRKRESRTFLLTGPSNRVGRGARASSNLMMKSIFRKIQKEWDDQQLGVKIRGNEKERVSHMIFADNYHFFVENKTQMLKMIGDATKNLKKRGLEWKEREMELILEALEM